LLVSPLVFNCTAEGQLFGRLNQSRIVFACEEAFRFPSIDGA